MRFHTYLTNVEIRRVSEGRPNKDGKISYSIRIEDSEGDPLEISCRDSDLFPAVQRLRKGDMVDLPILCLATEKYQFCALVGAPEVLEDDE